MKKYLLIFLIFSNAFVSFSQCQWDRFKVDTDETTDAGRKLTEAIDNNPDLIDAWEILDNSKINPEIRRNIDYLEITNKMKKPFFSNDTKINTKFIKQVIEGLDQVKDKGGSYIYDIIMSGKYQEVDGYKTLIGAIKKSGDENNHLVFPAAQTFRRMDKSKAPLHTRVLEDKTIGDIDYGELATNGTHKYNIAYQFKTIRSASGAKNKINIKDIEKQLSGVDANHIIFEIEIRSGTLSEALSDAFLRRVKQAKELITNLEVHISDTTGEILKKI